MRQCRISLLKILKDFLKFWKDFRIGWILLALLAITAFCGYKICVWIALALFLAYLAYKPMNVVYGFIGTKGNITHFIILIIIINIIFSVVYFWGFFKHAGITYDTSQPYISYGMFYGADKKEKVRIFQIQNEIKGFNAEEERLLYVSDRINEKGYHYKDTVVIITPAKKQVPYFETEHIYQRIDFWTTLQNTFLTSLIQEPTELFSQAVDNNDIQIGMGDDEQKEQDLNGCVDKDMSSLFRWVLILQVFISWIFFGVFISILYNKFRYES